MTALVLMILLNGLETIICGLYRIVRLLCRTRILFILRVGGADGRLGMSLLETRLRLCSTRYTDYARLVSSLGS